MKLHSRCSVRFIQILTGTTEDVDMWHDKFDTDHWSLLNLFDTVIEWSHWMNEWMNCEYFLRPMHHWVTDLQANYTDKSSQVNWICCDLLIGWNEVGWLLRLEFRGGHDCLHWRCSIEEHWKASTHSFGHQWPCGNAVPAPVPFQ